MTVVVNSFQAALINQAAVHPGHALVSRFNEKMAKHGEPCRRAGLVFVPLPVETLGSWHEQAVLRIKSMGAALSKNTGQDDADKTRHLFQQLAVLLAKGNAALFLTRLPNHPSPDIDGTE